MKSKRSLALLLSVAMVISMLLMPAAAAETAPISAKPVFTDTAAHWAEKAIDRWSGYGIIKGDAGAFKPDADMTRAELATVLTNLLRLSVKAENTYADLVGTEWYAGGILKCTSAGIMKGDGKNCNAMATISRQEATVMIARALGVKAAETPDLSAFKDAASVATWAVGYVSAMAKSGIINGVGDGMLAPTTNINRASVMTILDRAITDYINKPGEYTITSTGLVVVTVPNVVLKNSKLNDLLVAEGVGEGDFTLNSTKVAGNATVRGGGVNSFVVMGASEMGSITISKVDGAVRVSVQGDAQVRVMFIDDGKDDVFIEGKVGAVTVSTDTPVTLRGADVKTVTATGENADITVDRTSKVETVASSSANTTVTVAGTVTTVAGTKEADGMSVNVSKGGTATNVVTAAPNTTLANDGKVGQASFAKEATGAKIVVGKDSTMEKVVNENKENLTTTTADAEAAAKAVASAKTEAEKQAAADAVAAAKAEADKVKEEINNKTEVKPVEPPKVEGGGTITVPDQPKPPEPPVYVDPYTHVTTAEELTAALKTATMIQIDSTLGSDGAYTTYEVKRPVTITGGTVYGSFVVVADGVTFDGVKIFNEGGDSALAARNAINAYCATLTIRNCTFNSGSAFANGVVIFPSEAGVTYNITGNTFNGYDNNSGVWNTTGLLIIEEYTLSSKPFLGTAGVTAANAAKATITPEAELAFMTGNTYSGCSMSYRRSSWTENNSINTGIATYINSTGLKAIPDLATGGKYYIGANMTIADATIPAGAEVVVNAGVTLTVNGTLTNNGTIVVNDEAGLRMATAVGGTVQLGSNITLTAGIDTLVNNLTLDGNGKTITFGDGFTTVYGTRGMVFQGKGITIKDLTIDSGGVLYPLAIHRFGDAVTVSATLTNVTVNGAGKTALDIACVDSLVLNNVKTTPPENGFGMVLDAVKNLSGSGSAIASVSIHNKWGAITNVNLANLGVTKVVVEDFSQAGYTHGDDTANKGDRNDWSIFDGTASKVFKAGTVTLPAALNHSVNDTTTTNRAYKVTFTAN